MNKWQPIETVPNNTDVMLYQPLCKEHYREEIIMIGQLNKWSDGTIHGIHPTGINGYEWECDLTHPTHWMVLPEPPK